MENIFTAPPSIGTVPKRFLLTELELPVMEPLCLLVMRPNVVEVVVIVLNIRLICQPWLGCPEMNHLGVILEVLHEEGAEVQILIPPGAAAGRGFNDIVAMNYKNVPNIIDTVHV
jgi:hypothetical protein